jgi:hypothetical protein
MHFPLGEKLGYRVCREAGCRQSVAVSFLFAISDYPYRIVRSETLTNPGIGSWTNESMLFWGSLAEA